jgi:DNA-binding transcriptional LysR family regulator
MDTHVRDLRYFIAVADHGSFSRAAEALYLSQPALSKQIRALEAGLGVTLLDRNRRGAALTSAGTALLEHARQVIQVWDDGVYAARAAARAEARVLRVGTPTAIGRALYPRVVDAFAVAEPGWRIELRAIGWGDPTAGLADASTDVAFLWLPVDGSARTDGSGSTDDGPPLLSVEILARERRCLAVNKRHRLASREEVTFAEIVDEPLVALPISAGASRDFWLANDVRTAGPARVGAEANGADETFELVAAGTAAVLLAEGNAVVYARPGVVCLPVTDLPPAQLAVGWRSGDRRTTVRSFVCACRAAAQTSGP